MRLVLAGTPEVAVPSLDALLASSHDVVAVLTRPDAPAGRGRRLVASPVARRAEEAGVEVIRAARLSDPGVMDRLREIAPDCCPVVAYGALVPAAALSLPPHGWVNLHFSLLPAWRGAAPVQHALLHGDEVTGASVFQLEEGLDTGPVYGVMTEHVRPRDTSGELLGAAGRRRRGVPRRDPRRDRARRGRRGAAAERRCVVRPEAGHRRRPRRLAPARLPRRPPGACLHPGAGRLDHVGRRAGRARAGRAGRHQPARAGRRRGRAARRARRAAATGRRSGSARCARPASGRWRPTRGPAACATWTARSSARDGRPAARAGRPPGRRGRVTAGPPGPAAAGRRAAGRVRPAACGRRARRLRQPGAARAAARARPARPRRRVRHRARLRDAARSRDVRRGARRVRRPAAGGRSTRRSATCSGWAPTSCWPCGCRRTRRSARRSSWPGRSSARAPGPSSTRCCARWRAGTWPGWVAEVAPPLASDPVGHLAVAHSHPRVGRDRAARRAGRRPGRDRGGAAGGQRAGRGRPGGPAGAGHRGRAGGGGRPGERPVAVRRDPARR